MLTRNGEPIEHVVPGYAGRLTRSELDAYNAAFKTIHSEFSELEKIQEQLDKLVKIRWDHPANLRQFTSVETPDGGRWDAYGILLKLSKGDVLLCRQADGDQWAAIQRFPADSPYAQAHGSAEILLTGDNARDLTDEYMAQAQHTLRFMASNLVAKTQKIVWDQYSQANPDRVMRALSERCAHVVKNTEVVQEVESVKESVTQAPRQSRSMRV